MRKIVFTLLFSLISLQHALSFEILGVRSGMTKVEFDELIFRAKTAYKNNPENPTTDEEVLGSYLGQYNPFFCGEDEKLYRFYFALPVIPHEKSAKEFTRLKSQMTEDHGEPVVEGGSHFGFPNAVNYGWKLTNSDSVANFLMVLSDEFKVITLQFTYQAGPSTVNCD